MAAIVRVVQSPLICRFIKLQPLKQVRTISTSGKKRETISVAEPINKTKSNTETATSKNWVSYGFDYKDETDDRNALNSSFFVSVTLCLVVAGFVWAYLPDYGMRDWAQREGFLELRRREQQGLPLISADLIPIDKIALPSDEELGDEEIII